MNIGNQISNIRKEQQLTQEEFGRLFHVTRQTVSNWENEKSYPDLLTLINLLFIEVNPIPVKEAVNLIGFNVGVPRAPLTKIEDCNREKLIAAMKNYGMEIKA